MAEVLAHAQKYLKKAKTLFLSTDDSKARDKLAALLPPDIKIVQFTFPVKTNGLGVHYQNKNNDEVVFNALVDLYYLSRATYFVPSKHSGFSHLVTAIRKGLKFF